jgi:ferric-dicitrate binding protein FerR (iron transport regulator)
MDKDILARILTGEANSDEKENFYRCLSQNKEKEKEFIEMKDLWVRSTMENSTINVEAEYLTFLNKLDLTGKQSIFTIGKVLKYAAIFIALLSIGGLSGYLITKNSIQYAETGMQKYTAMKGSVSIIEFPDGTKVWLNSGSQLTYREDRKSKQRLAELTGEAYFEVKHREGVPLFVKANQIVVKDLGTTFNIRAYADDSYVETSLIEGKADILSSNGSRMISLKPGESAMYLTRNKSLKLRIIEENVLSAWRDGKFVIRDQRLEDIFKELSRWYDVKFTFRNEELRNYRYTGNIKKSTTAQHVMKMLKETANFNYQIIEKPDSADEIVIF